VTLPAQTHTPADDLLALTARAEAHHFWFKGFRQFVAPVLHALAGGRRDLRLIDCGCGTGANLDLLRPYGRAVGFDLAREGVARARGRGLAVARGDVTSIPFVSSAFDLASAFDVLQCVDDDVAAVREMARVVRPGGAVVVTLAALDVLRGDHAEAWHEVRRYTPESAAHLLRTAGLEVERLSFLFASVFPLMLAVRVAQRVLRPFRALRGDRDIRVPAAPLNAALTWLVSAEAALARRVRPPLGSSLLAVGRKVARK
jgi:SAM-dependent methyltransferase